MYDSDFSITTSPSMCMMIALVQTGPLNNLFFCSLGLGFLFFMPAAAAADATVLLSDLKSLQPCYQVIP